MGSTEDLPDALADLNTLQLLCPLVQMSVPGRQINLSLIHTDTGIMQLVHDLLPGTSSYRRLFCLRHTQVVLLVLKSSDSLHGGGGG